MNAPILFGSDFIKLMQITIQPKPNGAYLLYQRNQSVALGQLTPLSIQAMRKKKKREIVLAARIASGKLEREGERTFNDLRDSVTEVIRRGISSQLNPNQRKQMYEVLNSYQDVFAKHKYDLGRVPAELAKVTIDIDDNMVPCCKPYRLGEVRRREMNKIIDEMIANNIIEESDAPGGAPALLVQKPDKS